MIHTDLNRLCWSESLLVEGLEHLTLGLEYLTVLANLRLVRRVQETEKLDAGHHTRELATVFQSRVAIKHRLNFFSPLKWRVLRRVIRIALLCVVEDLVQLDDNLINQLLLVRVLLILFHENKELDDHVTSE